MGSGGDTMVVEIDIDDDTEEEYYTAWDTDAKSVLEVGIELGYLNEDGTRVEPVWKPNKFKAGDNVRKSGLKISTGKFSVAEDRMEGKVNLSEAQLYEMENKTMEPDEAVELLQEILAILNGPDSPSHVIVHSMEDIPSAIQEVLDIHNDLVSAMEDIKNISEWS